LLRRIPISVLSVINGILILSGLLIDSLIFESSARYPLAVLIVGGALMAYLPYYCVTRGETLFRIDPEGRASRTVFYGIAYAFLVVFLMVDIDLLRRWLSAT